MNTALEHCGSALDLRNLHLPKVTARERQFHVKQSCKGTIHSDVTWEALFALSES